jgi:hypothetical protein
MFNLLLFGCEEMERKENENETWKFRTVKYVFDFIGHFKFLF